MRFGIAPSVAPAVEPVSLADARAHLEIDITDHDDKITSAIADARRYVEDATGRCLVTQTWVGYLDELPAEIEVPRGPLASVSSITYTDTAGAVQTLAADQYQVDPVSVVPRIIPAYGVSWPSSRCVVNGVAVTMVLGYGLAAAVPGNLRRAVKLLVGSFFRLRENEITGTTVNEIPIGVARLIAPFRLPSVLFAA